MGSGYTGSFGFSSPLGFPSFAIGSPRRGRGLSVLDRNEGLVSPLRSSTLVSSWLDLPPLSAGICAPGPSGCVTRCPCCVLNLRFTLALSRVLHCPWLGFSVTSPSLARGLGLSFVLCPLFCRLGLVPRLMAQLCALLPLVPSFRVYLSEAADFGGFLILSICAPLPVGLLPGSPTLLCLLSAGCLLGLEPSPLGEASASSCQSSYRPGAAGALAVTLPEAASQREFFPLGWVLPLPGSVTFSRVCSSVESRTHSIPRSFLVVALSASAVGFTDSLWLCPERTLRRLFASVSLLAPVALSPPLHRVFPDGFRLWCVFHFCRGTSPLTLVP